MSNFTVQIKDYQSIVNAEIVIEDGLNIIVGKTNAGKSAVLRAINDAIFNKGDDEMVKKGKRYAGVKVDNGTNKFVWRRDSQGKNEKTLYQINEDKPITKVGRTQLEEINKLFNITDVRLANGVKEKINFWFQGDAPFLTNKTAGQLFEFLSQSSCEKYIKVVKKIESDMKSQKATMENLNGMVDALRIINESKKEYLEKNTGYDELYIKVVVMNSEVDKFNKLEDMMLRRDSLKARIFVKSKELDNICNTLDKVDFENIKLGYDSIIKRDEKMEKIKELLHNLKSKRDVIDRVSVELKKVNLMLPKANEGLNKIGGVVTGIEDREHKTASIKALLMELKSKNDKKKTVRENLKKVEPVVNEKEIKKILQRLEGLENTDKTNIEIRTLINEFEGKNEKRIQKQLICTNISKELVKSEEEFSEFKTFVGVCPFCNSALVGEHGC